MRLLVLSTSFPTPYNPGSGIFVHRMVTRLPQDIAVTVLTPDTPHLKGAGGNAVPCRVAFFRYAPRSIQTLAHAPGGIPAALQQRPIRWLLVPFFCAGMALEVWRLARQADLIHANWLACGLIAGAVGRFLGVPVVTTLRGTDVAWAVRSCLLRRAIKWMSDVNQRVVVVSQAMAGCVRKWVGPRKGCVQVIVNGVEPQLAATAQEATASFDIAVVGSLSRAKGVDLVIQALAVVVKSCPRARLVIVGDGPERTALCRLANRLGVAANVEFVGSLAPQAVASVLARCRALVLASAHEGRPNVVLEAMACGVPVVVAEIDGVREVITPGETGLLFARGDVDQLAERLIQLYSQPSLADFLAVNARRWILGQDLTWENTAGRYARLYAQVLADRRKKKP